MVVTKSTIWIIRSQVCIFQRVHKNCCTPIFSFSKPTFSVMQCPSFDCFESVKTNSNPQNPDSTTAFSRVFKHDQFPHFRSLYWNEAWGISSKNLYFMKFKKIGVWSGMQINWFFRISQKIENRFCRNALYKIYSSLKPYLSMLLPLINYYTPVSLHHLVLQAEV
jgi:hypothetical protein